MSQLSAGGPPPSTFVSSVLGELGNLQSGSTLLVLDDFQAVDQSDEALEFVRRLANDAPPWVHLVISTRRRPKLELARFSAAAELEEISTEQLRFTSDEISKLFADAYRTPRTPLS